MSDAPGVVSLLGMQLVARGNRHACCISNCCERFCKTATPPGDLVVIRHLIRRGGWKFTVSNNSLIC